MPAAFFDLERTLTRDAVEMVAARELRRRGEGSRGELARVAWVYLLYNLGLRDFAAIKRAGAAVFTGRDHAHDVAVYREIYAARLSAGLQAAARERVAAFQADGVPVVIVSATYRYMVAPFAEELGIDDFVGQDLVIVDGRCTGELAGPIWHGEQKARFVHEYATEHGIDLAESWAFGDSWNDRPMLEAVGHPVAVDPGRKLRAVAEARGWEIATWASPR